MKNTENAKNIYMNQIQQALQLYDKAVLSKRQLEQLAWLDFKNGNTHEQTWDSFSEVVKNDFLMQLYDRQLITEEVLLKQTFNLNIEDSVKKDLEEMKSLSYDSYEEENIFNGQNNVPIKVKKLDDRAIIPKYQNDGDAGFDFHALVDNNLGYVMVEPKSQQIIRTGVSCTIPVGYEIQVRPRSGLAYKYQITVTNSPGTIDCVPKGTKIMTPSGEINIEDLYKSKEPCVYSYNEDTKEVEEDIVEDMWIVKDLELLEIKTEEGFVRIPLEKEVYTKDGWKRAKNLTDNDEILHF